MTRRRPWGAIADSLRDCFPPGALDALQAKLDALPRCSHCGGIVRRFDRVAPGPMKPCPRCSKDVCVPCAEHPVPERPRVKGSCTPPSDEAVTTTINKGATMTTTTNETTGADTDAGHDNAITVGALRPHDADAEDKPQTPVCSRCNDTHTMQVGNEERGYSEVPCTFCPVPCQACRSRGPGLAGGPYCATTPCACECHKAKAAASQPVQPPAQPPTIRRRFPVESSNLATIGYDPDAQALDVIFTNGAHWRYAKVPAETFAALANAESVGRYFAREIRNRYPGTRVDELAAAESKTP